MSNKGDKDTPKIHAKSAVAAPAKNVERTTVWNGRDGRTNYVSPQGFRERPQEFVLESLNNKDSDKKKIGRCLRKFRLEYGEGELDTLEKGARFLSAKGVKVSKSQVTILEGGSMSAPILALTPAMAHAYTGKEYTKEKMIEIGETIPMQQPGLPQTVRLK